MDLRPLLVCEIAHVLVSNKVGIIDLLKAEGLLTDSNAMGEEEIFHIILENKANDKITMGILTLLRQNPFMQHCVHCWEKIQSAYEKGIVVNNELAGK